MTDRGGRTDWALLLPPQLALPVPEVLVFGGTEEMAEGLVASGLARSWRRAAASLDRCAMTVAWSDARCSLEELAARTKAGGVMIIEIDRRGHFRWRRSLAGAQRRLRRVGSTVSSAHLVQPSFERPIRYLPVTEPQAVRWYFNTLFIAPTPAMRLMQMIVKAVTKSPLATQAIAAVSTRTLLIAAAGAGDGTIDAGPSVSAQATERRVVRPGEQAIVLTSGYDAASRSVVLPFAPGDTSPNAVLKVASTPNTAAGTIGEHTRLMGLHAVLPMNLALSLPLPMPLTTTSIGRTVCMQTCAAGPNMNASIGRWGRPRRRKRADLDLVVDWLTRFGASTRVPLSGERAAWMDGFARFEDSVAHPEAVSVFIARASDVAAKSGLADFAVQQHYDTGPWNIHISSGRPFLLDWETDSMRPADSLGPPLADILYLVTYWYFLMRGVSGPEQEAAALVQLFVDPVPVDADVIAARRAIDRALAAIGLGRVCVPAALAAMWAERAWYTQQRRALLGKPLETGQNLPAFYLEVLGNAAGDLWGDHGWWAAPVDSAAGGPVDAIRRRAVRWRRGPLFALMSLCR